MSSSSSALSILQEHSKALTGLVDMTLPRTASIWVKTVEMATSSGSGWALDRTHIVTNHHVVSQGLDNLRVRMPGQMEKIGHVIGSDAQTDLAVIEVDDVGTDAFEIRLEPEPMRGELCMTLGSPLGQFNESVSLGVISGLHRQIDLGTHKFEEAIQTDATINPGNSGGPLVDMHGRLIGVNFMKRTDAAQLNFAIPSEVISDIVPELISFGGIARAGIGVAISAVPATVGGQLRDAVEVQRSMDGSPLRRGDIILAINGKKVQRRYDLMRELNRSTIGTNVELMVYRDESVITVSAEARERQ